MDFRLHRDVDRWMKKNRLVGDCDIVSVAGAGKDIVDNPNGFVMNQIALSKKLHNSQTVVLIHHMDCGAYGGHGAFNNYEAERNFQIFQMKKAAKIVQNKIRGLRIKILLAHLHKQRGVEIEEV
jgi:carbonic anhydrase